MSLWLKKRSAPDSPTNDTPVVRVPPDSTSEDLQQPISKRATMEMPPKPSISDGGLSVPDAMLPALWLMLVGINPGLASARAAYPYAGASNAFWPSIAAAQILPPDCIRTRHLRAPSRAGVGLCNLVDRESAGSADLSRADRAAGARALLGKLCSVGAGVIVCNGKEIFDAMCAATAGAAKEQLKMVAASTKTGGKSKRAVKGKADMVATLTRTSSSENDNSLKGPSAGDPSAVSITASSNSCAGASNAETCKALREVCLGLCLCECHSTESPPALCLPAKSDHKPSVTASFDASLLNPNDAACFAAASAMPPTPCLQHSTFTYGEQPPCRAAMGLAGCSSLRRRLLAHFTRAVLKGPAASLKLAQVGGSDKQASVLTCEISTREDAEQWVEAHARVHEVLHKRNAAALALEDTSSEPAPAARVLAAATTAPAAAAVSDVAAPVSHGRSIDSLARFSAANHLQPPYRDSGLSTLPPNARPAASSPVAAEVVPVQQWAPPPSAADSVRLPLRLFVLPSSSGRAAVLSRAEKLALFQEIKQAVDENKVLCRNLVRQDALLEK